jgi:hypothetical protein
MRKVVNNKVTLILVLVILLLLTAGFIGKSYYERKLQKKDEAYKTEVLKNDSLQRISDTQYRKLVADTLKLKEVQKLVDSLGIQLDTKPKVVFQTEFVPVEIEKPVDSISIIDDIISIVDYYPQKENYFIRYQNKVSLLDKKGNSIFSFNPVDISIVLSQREDGLFQSDVKVPDFLSVGDVDIRSTPLEPTGVDNFGLLLGAGLGKDFKTEETFLRVSGGLRFKKFYLDVGANTNQVIDAGIKFEF